MSTPTMNVPTSPSIASSASTRYSPARTNSPTTAGYSGIGTAKSQSYTQISKEISDVDVGFRSTVGLDSFSTRTSGETRGSGRVSGIEAAQLENGNTGDLQNGKSKGQDHLARKLTARQVQLICVGGTIGTGLFLGTGKALSTGGPASLLLAYIINGVIVWQTMLCLGEMSAYMPIAGTFSTYASRFVDEGLGFALTWNYWFNDAVSVAGDLTALQMLLGYWGSFITWPFSLGLLLLLILANLYGVRVYGHIEYALSIIKVITIVLFIVIGFVVFFGGNSERSPIWFKNWRIDGAPFVGGFGGFLSVFVTAAFAFGGTESIGVTAGETKNPRRTMPSVIQNVFWRILLFYVMGTLVIGLDVPWDAPGLKDGNATSSPFTLVFELAGLQPAAHIMNAVVVTSVISAGNHALFAGTRLLYALAAEEHAPKLFKKLSRHQTPVLAVLATSAISCICFASSYVGNRQLWIWLQALVGVSNQIAWVCIGITSWRFRRAMKAQGKDLKADLPFINPFATWGPLFVFFVNIVIIILQGWESVVPHGENWKFSAMDFLSFYIEIPALLLMWGVFKLVRRTKIKALTELDLETDRYYDTAEDIAENDAAAIKKPNVIKKVFKWCF